VPSPHPAMPADRVGTGRESPPERAS
jgi:hypothetical protein